MATAPDIIQRFAPILAQKVDDEWPAADQIAPLDYAGSLRRIADNPKKFLEESAKDYDFRVPDPKVYYSLCETTTHYFLLYAVYHIMDWWKRLKPDNLYDLIRDRLDEHVHDMEGALLVVRKEPEAILDAVITIAHFDFYLYSQPRRAISEGGDDDAEDRGGLAIVKFNESIDGNIWLDNKSTRVKLYIESKGHGIWGDHKRWGGGDRIFYYQPRGVITDPAALNSDKNNEVISYDLEDLFAPKGLWSMRFHRSVMRQKDTGQWGFVHRKKLETGGLEAGAAVPPWSWNDRNDTSPIGEIATDPAQFILRYAQGWGPVSTYYLQNPYFDIRPAIGVALAPGVAAPMGGYAPGGVVAPTVH